MEKEITASSQNPELWICLKVLTLTALTSYHRFQILFNNFGYNLQACIIVGLVTETFLDYVDVGNRAEN